MTDVTPNSGADSESSGIPPIPPPTQGYWPGGGDEMRADLTSMEDAAVRLKSNVQERLAPAAGRATETLYDLLPAPHEGFAELQGFQDSHFVAQDSTLTNVQNYTSGTWAFGVAVDEIAKRYAGTDAFAAARLRDVESTFGSLGFGLSPYQPTVDR